MKHRLHLLDIDGVLADERHRVDFALMRDWGNYFDGYRMLRDGVWPEGRALYLDCLASGDDTGYCTGRREDLMSISQRWMQRTGVFDPTLPMIMRKEQHTTRGGWPLAALKARIITECAYMYDEVVLYDDDPEVCARVNEVPGARAVHCTWYEKPTRLVKRGLA